MKKIIVGFLMAAMILALAGCGGSKPVESQPQDETKSIQGSAASDANSSSTVDLSTPEDPTASEAVNSSEDDAENNPLPVASDNVIWLNGVPKSDYSSAEAGWIVTELDNGLYRIYDYEGNQITYDISDATF